MRVSNPVVAWGLPFLVLMVLLSGCGDRGGDGEACLAEGTCGPVVESIRVSGDIPMNPDADFWKGHQGPKKIIVELGPQMITTPSWPNPSIKSVTLQAARNDRDLALRLEWKDDSKDDNAGISSLYIDMAAVMFPLFPGKPLPPITMGGEGEPVNIWQWKDPQEPPGSREGIRETSSAEVMDATVEDLDAEGFSTLTRQSHQDVKAKSLWKDNSWMLVFKRALETGDDNDVRIGKALPIAIAAWNGSNKERNGQKGLAGWLLLR